MRVDGEARGGGRKNPAGLFGGRVMGDNPLEVGEDLMRISIGDRVTVDRRAPSLLR